MKKAILALAWLFLVLPAGWGRIGEADDKITERYGNPDARDRIDEREWVCMYRLDDFRVVVFFLDGKSQGELFLGDRRIGQQLSEEKINALLAINAFGSEWEALDSRTASRREWRRRDGVLMAFYNQSGLDPGLMILTKALRAKLAEEKPRSGLWNLGQF
jgi:hypothetical protein